MPSRIYYSYEKRCYVVRGQPGYYKNDLRRKKGKRYKAIPRWQYYLSKLSPVGLIKSGFDFLSIGKSLLFGGGFGGGDEDYDQEGDDADGDAAGGADDGNDNGKEPGLLSNGTNIGTGMFSPLLNLFGGSKDNNNNNNNENKKDNNDNNNENKNDNNDNNDKKDENQDDNKDNKEGEKPEESSDYMGMAKDALTSDIAKDAVKTGISLFVPGGSAIVAAMDAASKYNSVDEKLNKVEDKIPKI